MNYLKKFTRLKNNVSILCEDPNRYVVEVLLMIDIDVVARNVNLNYTHLVECMAYDRNNQQHIEYHKDQQSDCYNQLEERK